MTTRAGAKTVPDWRALDARAVLEHLGSSERGLTAEEAEARLARHGPNELLTTPPASVWRFLGDQLRSVIVLLLFAAAAVALAIGDPLDAAAVAAVLVVNTLIGFVAELRARRAIRTGRSCRPSSFAASACTRR